MSLHTHQLTVLRASPDDPAIAEAAQVLRDGGLVAFPTETVYGLGALATDAQAIQGIFTAKGRPSSNPLIVHVADVAMARAYALHWSSTADALAAAFWPGPLTLVVEKRASIPDRVTAGLPTVGLRVPAAPIAQALIEAVGAPLAAPSANPSEHISPTRAEHVMADLQGRIDRVLDGGPTTVGIESTVVDLTGETPRILRLGPIGQKQLEAILNQHVEVGCSDAHQPHASPGMMNRHYAPKTLAVRLERTQMNRPWPLQEHDVAVVVGPSIELVGGRTEAVLNDAREGARRLYSVLRQCDALSASRIVVVMPPDEPEWSAVRDRLIRATVPWDGPHM